MVHVITIFNYILIAYLATENLLLKNGFTERKLFTRSEIYHNDRIGCSDDFISGYKQTLMQKYNVEYDQVYFKCESVIDHLGKRHTKRYTEIKL